MSLENIRQESTDQQKKIAIGEVTPKDRLENQIRLATLLYGTLHDRNFDIETHEGRNKIMEFWTDSFNEQKSFSECYRKIEENPDFRKHPRFQGDIYKITINDILHYRDNDKLPEN